MSVKFPWIDSMHFGEIFQLQAVFQIGPGFMADGLAGSEGLLWFVGWRRGGLWW